MCRMGLRERVYALGHAEKRTVEAPPVAAAKPRTEAPAKAASNGRSPSCTADWPKCRNICAVAGQASIWQFLGTVAAACLIAALVLRLMGPFNSSHPVLALFNGPTVADANQSHTRADGSGAIKPRAPSTACGQRCSPPRRATPASSRCNQSGESSTGRVHSRPRRATGARRDATDVEARSQTPAEASDCAGVRRPSCRPFRRCLICPRMRRPNRSPSPCPTGRMFPSPPSRRRSPRRKKSAGFFPTSMCWPIRPRKTASGCACRRGRCCRRASD